MMVTNWYLLCNLLVYYYFYFKIQTQPTESNTVSSTTNMKLFPLLLALLPFVTANRVHKLQLHKIPPVAANAELESAYLAEKYGSRQLPLLGSGGSGRRMQRPTMRNGEQLLWTQEHINGGHPVPLTSTSFLYQTSIHHISAT